MKKFKKAILITAVLLAVLCLLAVLGYQRFAPKGAAGEKEITVKVIHGDSGEKEFTYTTDEEFLGAVLEAKGLGLHRLSVYCPADNILVDLQDLMILFAE